MAFPTYHLFQLPTTVLRKSASEQNFLYKFNMQFCLPIFQVSMRAFHSFNEVRMCFSIFNAFCILRKCFYFYFLSEQFKQLIRFEVEMCAKKQIKKTLHLSTIKIMEYITFKIFQTLKKANSLFWHFKYIV